MELLEIELDRAKQLFRAGKPQLRTFEQPTECMIS